MLGSSVPGASFPAGAKGACALEARAGYPARALAMPLEKHVPTSMGKRVGGVSERPTRKPGEQSSAVFRVATVEGTLVFGMAQPFAGLRRNEGLGRSDTSREVSSSFAFAPATAGVLWLPRRGTPSACAQKAHAPSRGLVPPRVGDASFARSRDPCTSIATTLRRRKPTKVARRMGYRGRANLRKREEPAPGSHSADVARLAACTPLPRGRQRGTSEKEGGCGLRPCEETRARAGARTS